MKEAGSKCRYIGGGARGLHHFTEMVGADCIVTINWNGTADKLLEQDPPVVQRFFMPIPHSVEDELLSKVEDFRKAYLADAIRPEEYEDYGPVVLFRSSFEAAWKTPSQRSPGAVPSLNNDSNFRINIRNKNKRKREKL